MITSVYRTENGETHRDRKDRIIPVAQEELGAVYVQRQLATLSYPLEMTKKEDSDCQLLLYSTYTKNDLNVNLSDCEDFSVHTQINISCHDPCMISCQLHHKVENQTSRCSL